jgi:hypothetical protein
VTAVLGGKTKLADFERIMEPQRFQVKASPKMPLRQLMETLKATFDRKKKPKK